MAPRKYTPAQQAALDKLAKIHADKVNDKATLELRLRAQLNDQLQVVKIKESAAANEALVLRVTKSDIGRALGTSNWDTIADVLALTADDYDVKDFDPLNARYAFEGELVRVTLTPAERAATFATFSDHDHIDAPISALFSTGGAFQGVNWLGSYEHPLSLWGASAENRAELVAWVSEHGEVVAA